MRIILGLWLLLLLSMGPLFSQENFRIELEEISISNAPQIHSFAYATQGERWLFVGGRSNGLHGFLPPLAFPSSGINDSIYLVDPTANQSWQLGLANLPTDVREAISSSNMQFQQVDSVLYMVGGYGWKQSEGDFITFPTLTAIDIPELINALISGDTAISGFFRQLVDSTLAICGAHMARFDSTFQLIFGHKFDGIYDRESHTGFHTQEYSYEIRRFTVQDDGQNLGIIWKTASVDSAFYRRRDYNLAPQVFPNGDLGFTAFSGVFQEGVNLPWLFPIDLSPGNERSVSNFDQRLANYHSALLPLYDSTSNYMHTVFFGGEALYYYDSTGTLIMDTLVPFVPTISRVTRAPDSSLSEYQLWSEMPALCGSNAQFIPLPSISKYDNGVLRLNPLIGRTLVGHIIGGIESPVQNISDTDPALSFASPRIFEVYIDKTLTAREPDKEVKAPVTIKVYPNPSHGRFQFEIYSDSQEEVTLILLDLWGQRLKLIFEGQIENGKVKATLNTAKLPAGIYYAYVSTGKYRKLIRLVYLGKK